MYALVSYHVAVEFPFGEEYTEKVYGEEIPSEWYYLVVDDSHQ